MNEELVEEWRPVIGSNLPWKVSNFGRLLLGLRLANVNKRQIGIRGKGTVSVGRLVLEAFVGPCPLGLECCHYDGNKLNNRLDNLRWDTHSNNMRDARRIQSGGWFRDRIGEDHPYSKLTEAKVLEAKKLSKEGWSWGALAERYGVCPNTVKFAVTGRNWSHLIGKV